MRFFLAICSIFALFCAPAFAEDAAIVKEVHGTVQIKRAEVILHVKAGDKLSSGDILITKKDSHIGVIFHDGSVLSLDENSYLKITDFTFKPIEKKFNFKLRLKKGTALFESGKISTLSPESFHLEVPEGTIGIRGTKFLVDVR